MEPDDDPLSSGNSLALFQTLCTLLENRPAAQRTVNWCLKSGFLQFSFVFTVQNTALWNLDRYLLSPPLFHGFRIYGIGPTYVL